MSWIARTNKIEQKPEVARIALATGFTIFEVAACLTEFWAWADEHTSDGVIPWNVGVEHLQEIPGYFWLHARTRCPDLDPGAIFAEAVRVGWLIVEDGKIVIVNFERYMGTVGRARLLNQRRQQR
jgi:hypothetical protein